MHVAVVGVGGLGSPVAEQLVRMGSRVTIVDHDMLDTPSNVRRIYGSRVADLEGDPSPSKVDVVGRHLDSLGFGPVRRIFGDVRSEAVVRSLLDTDAVINATDTHGSRAAINDLVSAYLLPVVDIGVRVGSHADGSLAALAAEVRVLTPATPCLWCRGAISADVIRAENLPPDQREQLEREGYVVGSVGSPAPSVVALTTLGASLATCALIGLLSEAGEYSPAGLIVDPLVGYAMESDTSESKPDCRCRLRLGRGDAPARSAVAIRDA